MEEKINILDINIDDYTAKQAMKRVIFFMQSEAVSVIEMVTVDMLVLAKEEAQLKESIEQSDMVLPGEKAILEAADITDSRQLQEVEGQTFVKMLLKYFHKNHCRVFLLVETEEDAQKMYAFFEASYRGVQIVGMARVAEENQADDMVINAINGAEVDCVLAALPSPVQEAFITRNRSVLNARIWFGAGKMLESLYKVKNKKNRFNQFLVRRIFKKEMEKQKKDISTIKQEYSCKV